MTIVLFSSFSRRRCCNPVKNKSTAYHMDQNRTCHCHWQCSTTPTSHLISSHRIHRIASTSHRIASHRIASHRIASHRIASHRIARIASHRHLLLFSSLLFSSLFSSLLFSSLRFSFLFPLHFSSLSLLSSLFWLNQHSKWQNKLCLYQICFPLTQ